MDRDSRHWATRPVSLILVIALVQLAGNLIVSAIAAYIGGLMNSSDQSLLSQSASYLVYLFDLTISLIPVILTMLLFFAAHKGKIRDGLSGTSTWQVNRSFWVGLMLFCVYLVLVWLHTGNADLQDYTSVLMSYTSIPLGILNIALCIGLVYPVLFRRHGEVKSALILSTAFALVSAVLYLIFQLLSIMLTPLFTAGATSESTMMLYASFLPNLLSSMLSDLALYMLGSALLLLSKRSIPGAWLLLAALSGLSTLSARVLLPYANSSNLYAHLLYRDFPVDLLLFAVGLAIMACLERYKTPGSFVQAAKALLARVRGTADDVTN